MLINLRNALMAGERLPYDAEVEYLESSGTQYIDTGVDAQSCEIRCDFDLGGVNTYETVFGVQSPANNFLEVRRNGNNENVLQVLARNKTTTATMQSGRNSFIGTWDSSGCSGTLNGTALSISSGAVVGSAGYHIFLFAANQDKAPAYYLSGKIYFFQMRVGGVLVHDYIPVRKGTVGYLYDRVSGKLFGNAGTGDFVLGQDVVPVEYIENGSNRIQVIDTGFYANQNTKSLITFEKLGADGWLFGSRNGSSSATDKFGIFAYRSPDGKISAQVGNIYIEPIISGGLTNRKKTIELSLADGVTVDGETIATFSESQKSQTFTSTYPMALFNMRVSSSGFNTGIYCRVYAYQIFENGLITRNFLPIRVGTDATSWEGAMMDTLTRRIYRNAGTGAFAYGNDLKYPIPAA